MANPHPNYFSGPFALSLVQNYNLEADIIPVIAPGMVSSLREFTFRVLTLGPVAKKSVAMSVVTDGAAYAQGEGATERGPGPIPANKINFFPTANTDIIELVIRTTG